MVQVKPQPNKQQYTVKQIRKRKIESISTPIINQQHKRQKICDTHKWLNDDCNLLTDSSRDKIIDILLGQYAKQQHNQSTVDLPIHSYTTQNRNKTRVFRMNFDTKKWRLFSKSRK